MRRKLNYEFVKKYFEEQGCVLLENEYLHNKQKMKYICSCGRQSETTWNRFSRGGRCMSCGHIGKRCKKKPKYSYEFVKNYFEEQGCTLLESIYAKSSTPMKYVCKCGRESIVCFSNFKRGARCRLCANEKNIRNFLKYEYVEKYFKEHECLLLEKEYKGSQCKMEYVCSCGNKAITTWSRFRHGSRCRICLSRKQSVRMTNPNREEVIMNKVIARRCNAMLRRILKMVGKRKQTKSTELLGYSKNKLKNHLMSHPNWRGNDIRWTIDHIFPIKAFLEHGITDLKIINCLENLQPLEHFANLTKNDKYDKKAFRCWLKTKAIAIAEQS